MENFCFFTKHKNPELSHMLPTLEQQIGSQLRKYRDRERLSTLDLSKRSKIRESRIISFEEGKSLPNMEDLIKITSVLDVEIVFRKKSEKI